MIDEIDELMSKINNSTFEEEAQEKVVVEAPIVLPAPVSFTEPIIIKEEPKAEVKEEDESIKVSVGIKESYYYNYSRYLSEDGLPDDFSHLGNFLMAFLSDSELSKKFYIETDKLEKDKNNPYTTKMIHDAIYARPKEYYKSGWLARRMRELDKRFNTSSYVLDDNKDKKVQHAIRNEIKTILKELNADLPIINDCLIIATTIAIKFTDLKYRNIPREMIFGKSNYGDAVMQRKETKKTNGL